MVIFVQMLIHPPMPMSQLIFFSCITKINPLYYFPTYSVPPPSLSISTDTCRTAELSRVGLNKNGYCQCMQWLPHEYCLVLRRLYSTPQLRRYCSFPIQLDKNSNYFYCLSPIFNVELIKMLIYWVLYLCPVQYLIEINYICSWSSLIIPFNTIVWHLHKQHTHPWDECILIY